MSSSENPAVAPFHVVIPARYASTRFPGKPLVLVAGRAMILRVVDQARAAGARSVLVATDDERIADAVTAEGFADVAALMTRADHPSGSDRVMEAALLAGLPDDALVVNVQGDEPLIPPAAIRQVAQLLSDHQNIGAATLSEAITTTADLLNPNIVKVVSSEAGRALYFSRAPIPHARGLFDQPELLPEQLSDLTSPEQAPGDAWQRHIGIYGYRLATLKDFVALPVAALEALESLEQLRLLANGIDLMVAPSCIAMPGGIDTPEDLVRVEQFLQAR
ncbi:MAG: 3-deoxy-manno-octulosonate cytidylyltransferase [Pseudomonadales bacterium]